MAAGGAASTLAISNKMQPDAVAADEAEPESSTTEDAAE